MPNLTDDSLAYGDDLAYIHDTGFGAFAAGCAPGLLALLRKAGFETGLVVDLGCGSGIWGRQLLDAGYQVHGVDLSADMIALAKVRAPEATWQVNSFADCEIPNCVAVTAIGEVLSYELRDTHSRSSLPELFARVFAALAPGGLFVFDLGEIGLGQGRPPTYREADDWACLVRFEYDDARDQHTRHITTFRRVGELYRRSHEVHRVQLYRPQEITGLLRLAGFSVRVVRRIGEFPLLPQRVGFVARKA
jgi:SAM-dependent methyltransferase